MHKLIGEQEQATIRTIALFQAVMDSDLARQRQPRRGASLPLGMVTLVATGMVTPLDREPTIATTLF